MLAPVPIPRGETRAAFPAAPTRLRVRAGRACQVRPVGRLEEVALTGAESGRRENRHCIFVEFDRARTQRRLGRVRPLGPPLTSGTSMPRAVARSI